MSDDYTDMLARLFREKGYIITNRREIFLTHFAMFLLGMLGGFLV